jgi:hypothetical protein
LHARRSSRSSESVEMSEEYKEPSQTQNSAQIDSLQPDVNSATTEFSELIEVYKVISNYDMHYSTMRGVLTTLLVTVAFAAGSSLIEKEHYFAAVVFPTIILAIGFVLNIHFQRLTWSCRKIRRSIEKRMNQITKIKIPARDKINPVQLSKLLDIQFDRSDMFSALSSDKPTMFFGLLIFLYLLFSISYL